MSSRPTIRTFTSVGNFVKCRLLQHLQAKLRQFQEWFVTTTCFTCKNAVSRSTNELYNLVSAELSINSLPASCILPTTRLGESALYCVSLHSSQFLEHDLEWSNWTFNCWRSLAYLELQQMIPQSDSEIAMWGNASARGECRRCGLRRQIRWCLPNGLNLELQHSS